jgi:hypothetical protein
MYTDIISKADHLGSNVWGLFRIDKVLGTTR